MKTECLLKIAALGLAVLAPLRGADGTLSATFSNPAVPGTVTIKAGRNHITVRGVDGNEVRATATKPGAAAPAPARTDGLRVLTPAVGFTLFERNNTVQLDANARRTGQEVRGGFEPGGAIEVTVPRTSSVIIQGDFDGNVTISDISGDVEVRAAMGKVKLEGLRGGADVQTNRGDIDASFAEVTGQKPLAFSSLMGAVVVRIPGAAKASVKLRSQNGQILTDFSESELAVRSEPMPERQVVGIQPKAPPVAGERGAPPRGGGQIAAEVRPKQQVAAVVGRDGAKVITFNTGPSFTGGHAIAGALNGGGTEIAITTLNGDVTLRKL